jgi:predicted RNA-binding Zn-ribbon protein involved in translation (DUF1610 family)
MNKFIEIFWVYVVTFIVLLLLNQLLFFGMCLSPRCLTAATPHVLILTLILGTLIVKENKPKIQPPSSEVQHSNYIANKITEQTHNTDPKDIKHHQSIDQITCPKCGASMIIKTASRGMYSGKNFLGCSQWPKCNGIVNL